MQITIVVPTEKRCILSLEFDRETDVITTDMATMLYAKRGMVRSARGERRVWAKCNPPVTEDKFSISQQRRAAVQLRTIKTACKLHYFPTYLRDQ